MARLRTVFRTANALTLPISGTGSAGMETCFVNLLEPGDTAIVGANGVFGDRMCEVARRCGAEVVRIEAEWGTAARSAATARRAARAPRTPASSRSCTPRRRPASRTTSRRSPRSATPTRCCCVDTVTSLGGIPVEIDGWGVDAALLGHAEVPRRAAGPVAGHVLAPGPSTRVQTRSSPAAVVVPRPVAHRQLRRRRQPRATTTPRRSRWCSRCTPRSARCSTRASRPRGPATARSARASRRALPELGFRLVVPERPPAPRAHHRVAARRRRRRDPAQGAARRPTASRSGGGLGAFAGKAWRIGLMGHSARERSVTTLLGALPRAAR